MAGQLAPTQPVRREDTASRPGCLSITLIVTLAAALAAAGIFVAWVLLQVVLGPYEGRIYPHVFALGVDLGGLTPAEAAVTLAPAAAQYDLGTATLRAGEQSWSLPWRELGLQVDISATVQSAYSVGRAEQSWHALGIIWGGQYDTPPALVLHPDVTATALELLAPDVAVPPVNGTLRLEGDSLVTVPGSPRKATKSPSVP